MLNIAEYGSGSEEDEPTESSIGVNFQDSLPAPIHRLQTIVENELEDEVTHKRAWEIEASKCQLLASKKKLHTTGKVKIFLPEFSAVGSESEEDDEKLCDDTAKTLASTSASCTLLSMLPKPTCCTTNRANSLNAGATTKLQLNDKKESSQQATTGFLFKPSNVVKNQPAGKNVMKPVDLAPHANQPKVVTAKYGSSSESDSDSEADFFSLTQKQSEATNYSLTVGDKNTAVEELVEIQQKSHSTREDTNVMTNLADSNCAVHPSQAYNLAVAPCEAAQLYQRQVDDWHQRDDEVRRLISANETMQSADGTNFQLPDDLNIVDVSVDSHLGDVRENLLRNLTQQKQKPVDAMLVAAQMAARQPEPGAKGGKGKDKKPDQTAKRKHQITYLAHLAKEREEDLQNQWAQNRHTKRETRMKYGF